MKRVIIVLLAVIVLGGGYWVLSRGARPAQQELVTAGVTETEIPAVKAPNVVVADAKVVPVRSAALSMPTAGIVAEVFVREGDRVEAGAALLRLDDARQRAAVAQAAAQLQRAEANLAQLKQGPRPQEIEAAEAAVDAARAQVAKVSVAGPPLEVTIAQSELRRAQAQLEMLRLGERPENIAVGEAEVAAALAALQQAEASLREMELRAPFAGVVASLVPAVGEYVSPGTPVAWLADDSAWQIETEDLTELAVVRLRVGASVAISIDALPDLELTGRVASIKPMGENRLGDITYKVVIVPDSHDPRLRWNMTASVTISEE